MNRLISIVILSLLLAMQAVATVYKKVNPDGSAEYSGTPQKGFKEIKLKPIHTIPAIKIPPPAATKKVESATESIETFKYTSLEITSPKDDEGIRNNSGQFTATAKLEPALRPQYEHHIVWILDGNKVELGSATGLQLKIENLARGTHQLQIRVIDYDANVIIKSSVISFHMFRAVKAKNAP